MELKSWFFALRSLRGRYSLRLLAEVLRDEAGSFLLYGTIAMPVFIGVAGLATEGGLLFYNHRTLQSAADAAAYSAAISYSIDSDANNAAAQAKAIVASYGFTLGTNNNEAHVTTPLTIIPHYASSADTAIKVDISRPQSTFFASMFFPVLPNSVSATAVINGGNSGGNNGQCILGLAPTGTDIALQGNPSIVAADCGIFSNSASTDSKNPSISLGGNASITAGSVGAVGSVSVGGSANIGPPPGAYTSGNGAMTDPYSGLTIPTPGTCYPSNTGVVKNQTGVILQPGTYCNGGINVSVHSSVTLSPGLYVFDNSALQVDAGSSITGKGVTLVFIDSSGSQTIYPKNQGQYTAMNITSGAIVDLEAPDSSPSGTPPGIPDMLILADPNIPSSVNFDLWANGTGSTGISGVIYAPSANFVWGGGPILTGGCTQMIAYTISLQGNASFHNSGCDDLGGGGNGVKPIGSVVTLVE
jgi:Putative Flp pilus-assembly TadE/G-like